MLPIIDIWYWYNLYLYVYNEVAFFVQDKLRKYWTDTFDFFFFLNWRADWVEGLWYLRIWESYRVREIWRGFDEITVAPSAQ